MLTENLKVAIVHDWLITHRGGEKVLEALLEMYPKATLFTLIHDKNTQIPFLKNQTIHTSFLQKIPYIKKYYRYFLPFFPMAIESFDLREFDLVISSSHCVAKGVITSPKSIHICYCYSPMRYLWDQRYSYFKKIGFLKSLFLNYLRIWDVTSSQRVDYFIGISKFIQRRIELYYRRTSEVIYPFYDSDFFKLGSFPREDFYLTVSALVPYKNIALAIEACKRLNRKLVVVGQGPQLKHLKSISNHQITFLENVDQDQLKKLYQTAKAFLFPSEEDFGIVTVEALACGLPCIAFKGGASVEIIQENLNGVFFHETTPESVIKGIELFESSKFDSEVCNASAQIFSRSTFKESFKTLIQKATLKKAQI